MALAWTPALPSCLMMRHQLLAEIGGFYPIYPGAENYDFFLRLLARHPLANLPEPMATIRDVNADLMSRKLKRALLAMLRIQRRYIFSKPYFTLPRAIGFLGRCALLLLPAKLLRHLYYTRLCVKAEAERK